MKTKKYKELIDVHLQGRIWRNELEMALLEIDFWEELMENNSKDLAQEPSENKVEMMSRLHHYQRVAQNLLVDVQQQDHEVAEGVQIKRALALPSPLDRKYLREQMDLFRHNFQEFKNDIRRFMVAQPS